MVMETINENDTVNDDIGDSVEGLNVEVLQLVHNSADSANADEVNADDELATVEEINEDFLFSLQRHEIYVTNTLQHIRALLLSDNPTLTQQDKNQAFQILSTVVEENKSIIQNMQSKKEMLENRECELIQLRDELKFQNDAVETEVCKFEKLLNFYTEPSVEFMDLKNADNIPL